MVLSLSVVNNFHYSRQKCYCFCELCFAVVTFLYMDIGFAVDFCALFFVNRVSHQLITELSG